MTDGSSAAIARRHNFPCFVDLLLTWNFDSKKPRGRRGVMHCSYWYIWLRE